MIATGCALPPCEPSTCTRLGLSYRDGRNGEKDEELAARLFQKACSAGGADGCSHLAYLYEGGAGVERDERRAEELYKKGCELGSVFGCRRIGSILEKRGDITAAADSFERGCHVDKEAQYLCRWAALQRAKLSGEPAMWAVEFLQASCSGDDPEHKQEDCSALASIFESGDPALRSATRAAEARQRACDAGDAESCGALALPFAMGIGASSDKQRAQQELKKACDKGHYQSCSIAQTIKDAKNDQWLIGQLTEVKGGLIKVKHSAGKFPAKGDTASTSASIGGAGSFISGWIVNAEGEVKESSPSEIVFVDTSDIRLKVGLAAGVIVLVHWEPPKKAP